MTFLETLEYELKSSFSFGHDDDMEKGLCEILDTFKTFGEYLNQITNCNKYDIEDLIETIYDYHIKKRNYYDFKNGENYMLFRKRDLKVTPGKTRITQDINILKKARNLLRYVSSKDYRIMQGDHGSYVTQPDAPHWEKSNDGTNNMEKYDFTVFEHREIGLKAFYHTIDLYENRYAFEDHYRVQKDVFNTYWFLTALIKDLENGLFELFEKGEYYNPEKPSKRKLKNILKFLRFEYQITASNNEKELIDRL